MYSLSDCVNWSTNVYGDCSGRVEKVGAQIICEGCRNNPARNSRGGYDAAKSLIADLDGDARMARHAVPPAMPEAYRTGFLAACDDAVKRYRPNRNYILSVMRDCDMDDPWGTAMAWAFACAETLTVLGADVPAELGYQPSPYVRIDSPETFEPESYEDGVVWEFLLGGKVIQPNDALFGDRISQVQFAARCISRYIDWCKAAGKDY